MTQTQAQKIADNIYGKMQLAQPEFAGNIILDVYQQGYVDGKKLVNEEPEYCSPRDMLKFAFLWLASCIAMTFLHHYLAQFDGWWVYPAKTWTAIMVCVLGIIALLAFLVACAMVTDEQKAKQKKTEAK